MRRKNILPGLWLIEPLPKCLLRVFGIPRTARCQVICLFTLFTLQLILPATPVLAQTQLHVISRSAFSAQAVQLNFDELVPVFFVGNFGIVITNLNGVPQTPR